MIKHTKEEISLCKQIAEKHRKEKLELGDWYLLKLLNGGEQIRLHADLRPWILLTKDFIPLWTISDCLKFLREKDYQVEINSVSDSWFMEIWKIGHRAKAIKEWTARLLETCLKLVLAVLEEGKWDIKK